MDGSLHESNASTIIDGDHEKHDTSNETETKDKKRSIEMKDSTTDILAESETFPANKPNDSNDPTDVSSTIDGAHDDDNASKQQQPIDEDAIKEELAQQKKKTSSTGSAKSTPGNRAPPKLAVRRRRVSSGH